MIKLSTTAVMLPTSSGTKEIFSLDALEHDLLRACTAYGYQDTEVSDNILPTVAEFLTRGNE